VLWTESLNVDRAVPNDWTALPTLDTVWAEGEFIAADRLERAEVAAWSTASISAA
jgi:hypothetical protein